MIELAAAKFELLGNRLTLLVPAEHFAKVKDLAIKCPSGQLRVSISRPSRPRTIGQGSQNAHINGHCQQIAQETGNEFADVKTAAKFNAIKRGYPFRTIAGQVVPFSESELNTEQAAMLIEELHQIAAEMGITLHE